MVETATEETLVAIAVSNRTVPELHFVRDEPDSISFQVVGGIERIDRGLSVDDKQPREIETAEQA